MKQKRYRLVTLGCRTNQYETQAYRAQLEAVGFEAARPGEKADLCIVNSCTVTHAAHRDSKRAVRRLVRENPGARVAVTGCAVEGDWEVSGSVKVVPNRDKENLISHLFPELEKLPEFKIDHFAGQTRAFVKVQDGCNSFCTYCIIPYVRGRSRSRTVEEILAEVKQLVANGYKEVVLTGINIGDFDGGRPDGERLADLVRVVDQVEGLERLRLSSIDPDEVDDDLASAILEGKHTCPSMHIVLQTGSNFVLKRMNRKYTRQIFLETVERLRSANPDFTFTTDVIVGFPGETERDFEETIEVMQQVRFAKVHMFPFSPRQRTRAALYSDQIPDGVKRERKQRLLREAEQQAYHLREEFVGRVMWVLTETGSMGHTSNFLSVEIEDSQLEPNQLVEVELVANTPTALTAHAHRHQRSA